MGRPPAGTTGSHARPDADGQSGGSANGPERPGVGPAAAERERTARWARPPNARFRSRLVPDGSLVKRLHPQYPAMVQARGTVGPDALVCEFLDYFSSVFVCNIKEPVPKDPSNRPACCGCGGRRAPRSTATDRRRRVDDDDDDPSGPAPARRVQRYKVLVTLGCGARGARSRNV